MRKFIKYFCVLAVLTMFFGIRHASSENILFSSHSPSASLHKISYSNDFINFLDLNDFIFGDEDLEEDDNIISICFSFSKSLIGTKNFEYLSVLPNHISFSQKIPLYLLYGQLKAFLV